jgi:hypothetical protein
MPAVVREDWIVPDVTRLALEPRVDSNAYIEVVVIVSEVVVAIARIAKQAKVQMTDVHDDAERVRVSRPPVIVPREIHRSVQNSPRRQNVVPVPWHKYITMRRPDIMRRNPNPVVSRHEPVTRSEDIVVVPPVIT